MPRLWDIHSPARLGTRPVLEAAAGEEEGCLKKVLRVQRATRHNLWPPLAAPPGTCLPGSLPPNPPSPTATYKNCCTHSTLLLLLNNAKPFLLFASQPAWLAGWLAGKVNLRPSCCVLLSGAEPGPAPDPAPTLDGTRCRYRVMPVPASVLPSRATNQKRPPIRIEFAKCSMMW